MKLFYDLLASRSDALIVAPHSDPTNQPTHPIQPTYSSEAFMPDILCHLKIPTMQWNKNYLFRKDFCRKRRRQRQRQRMKKTQHVLYFRKAEDARISNMTFSPRNFPKIFPKFSQNFPEIFQKSLKNFREIFEKSLRNLWEIFEKSSRYLRDIFEKSSRNLSRIKKSSFKMSSIKNLSIKNRVSKCRVSKLE